MKKLRHLGPRMSSVPLRIMAIAGLLLGSLAGSLAATTAAWALPAQPNNDYSFYVLTTSASTGYNEGCDAGTWDANHGDINANVFLDFGGQNSAGNGTILINGTGMSDSQVEAYAEQAAVGYYVCTGADTTSTLFLSVGTNNSAYDVSKSGGETWAGVSNAVANYVTANAGQVGVWGGDDIEPSFGGASAAIAWAQGFTASSDSLFLDYGSADGCNQTSYNNSGCNNGWDQYDEWYVSYGSPAAVSAPEIYVTAQAWQWARISEYGAHYQGEEIFFEGPLDEHDLNTSTLTAAQAWTDMWNDNNSAGVGQTPPFSLEVHDG